MGTQSPEISRLTWVALEASFGIPSRSFETAQGWSNRQQPQGTAVGKTGGKKPHFLSNGLQVWFLENGKFMETSEISMIQKDDILSY